MNAQMIATIFACPIQRAERFIDALTDVMARCEINTPLRQAAFIAQIGHESGRFQYVRELWGPTPAQAGYEGRTDLGNTEPGDGYRYRGRGLIQVTGRANYRVMGAALGEDFESHPELLEQPVWAAYSAAWFWLVHGCNALADGRKFREITHVINGGLNGLADRVALYNKALEVVNGLA